MSPAVQTRICEIGTPQERLTPPVPLVQPFLSSQTVRCWRESRRRIGPRRRCRLHTELRHQRHEWQREPAWQPEHARHRHVATGPGAADSAPRGLKHADLAELDANLDGIRSFHLVLDTVHLVAKPGRPPRGLVRKKGNGPLRTQRSGHGGSRPRPRPRLMIHLFQPHDLFPLWKYLPALARVARDFRPFLADGGSHADE